MKNKKIILFAAAVFAIPALLVSVSLSAPRAGALTFQSAGIAGTAPTAPNSPAGNAGTSLNWAGYAATGAIFTSVNGSWIVPQSTAAASAVTNGGALSADATWVGIGGVSTQDLIQAGTQSIFQNGTQTYEAWYEILPNNSQEVPLTVHPGDAMTVSVAEQSTGDEWNISFVDATTGQSYNTSVIYQSSLSSAEWIEEMPSDQHGYVALDNFGTASFTNGGAVKNGSSVTISGANAQSLTMINGANQALATVSPLGANGASFTVTRTSATASTPSIYISRGNGRWSRTGVGVQGYTAPTKIYRTTTTGTTTGTSGGNGGGTATISITTSGGSNGNFPIGFGGFREFNGFPSFFRTFVNNFRNSRER